MTIYNNHPAYQDFIENEVKTLEYITNWGLFKDYIDLSNSVQQTFMQNSGRLKRGVLDQFNFHSKFVMEVENSNHDVIIGANVTNGFEECSYALAVLDKTEPTHLIRKFHFDYASSVNSTKQKVPSYHLQYGGRMSPKMQEDGLDDSKLDRWLSLPRLNFYPINLALIFDVMFCEFRTLKTTKIVENPNWRSLIFNNEKFLSCHYFNNVASHIQSANYTSKKLVRDFCYGG